MTIHYRRIGAWGAMGALGALLLALGGCDNSPEAPTNVGTCWRLSGGSGAKPDFTRVATGVRNLETCAANLEAVAMREKAPQLTGAFQGQFVFITPDMVQSSMRLDGARYRLFDAESRAKIDRKLQWMLDDQSHPSDFGPAEREPSNGPYVRHVSPPHAPTP